MSGPATSRQRESEDPAKRSHTLALDTMYLDVVGQVASITFNRPAVLNAGNLQWVADLARLGQATAENKNIRVVILRGNGRAFSSGIDLKVVSSRAYDFDWYRRWEEAITAFEVMEKITIAAIHGYCLGGGLQLALACDIRIAREDAVMALPAALEGLIPGLGPYRLARFVGIGRAKTLSLTGEQISAKAALELGLVDYVVSEAEFDHRISEVAKVILQGPITAQLHTKKITNMAFDWAFPKMFEEYLKRQKECVDSPDHAEAAAAYRRSKGLDR